MRVIIFICCFAFLFANAQPKSISIKDVYASAEDYNVRFAKEKAFKLAISRAVNILIQREGFNQEVAKWKLAGSMLSYQIKGEKIESSKYSAFFDILFDKGELDKLKNISNVSAQDKPGRIVCQFKKKDKILLGWVEGLSSSMDLPLLSYHEVDQLHANDIIISYTEFNKGSFILSVELEEYVINVTADDFRDNFAAILNIIVNEVSAKKMRSKNLIIMKALQNLSADKSLIKKELSHFLDVESIEVVAYEPGGMPKYLIKVFEKDDLFLSYVYNNNDYTLTDLGIFKQILEPL